MSSSSSTNDLRNRILFTIGLLAVYRFGTFVPLPGIDPEQLKILMEGNQKGLLGIQKWLGIQNGFVVFKKDSLVLKSRFLGGIKTTSWY